MFPYYLTSDQYIPERMIKHIDRTTSLIVQTGLNGFYEDFAQFLFQLRSSKILRSQDDLSVMDFHFLLNISTYFFLHSLWFSTIIFLIEISVQRFNALRNRLRATHTALN